MKNIQHFDILGQELFPGDMVAAHTGRRSTLEIYRILRLCDKQVVLNDVTSGNNVAHRRMYPKDVSKVEPKLVTLYVLKGRR